MVYLVGMRRASGPSSCQFNEAHKGGAWVNGGVSLVFWNPKEKERGRGEESYLDFPWLQVARFYNLDAHFKWPKSHRMALELWLGKQIII